MHVSSGDKLTAPIPDSEVTQLGIDRYLLLLSTRHVTRYLIFSSHLIYCFKHVMPAVDV